MSEPTIRFEGVEETLAALTALPKNIVKFTFAKAFAAAALPMVEAMTTRCPVDTGELKDSIETTIRINREGEGGFVAVGFQDKGGTAKNRWEASKARWLEYGHREIPPRDKGTQNVEGFVQPHPFMRPALAASADEAIEAFQDKVATELEAWNGANQK